MSSDTNWRGIIAALSNPAAREVFAEVVLGVDGLPALERLSPSRRRRVVDVLMKSGLVRHGADGRLIETRTSSRTRWRRTPRRRDRRAWIGSSTAGDG